MFRLQTDTFDEVITIAWRTGFLSERPCWEEEVKEHWAFYSPRAFKSFWGFYHKWGKKKKKKKKWAKSLSSVEKNSEILIFLFPYQLLFWRYDYVIGSLILHHICLLLLIGVLERHWHSSQASKTQLYYLSKKYP